MAAEILMQTIISDRPLPELITVEPEIVTNTPPGTHVHPAADSAKIAKHIGWHTFRHSIGSYLGQVGENVKVVQELLRHASSRIMQDCYQQADQDAKRSALSRFSGIFVVPPAKSA